MATFVFSLFVGGGTLASCIPPPAPPPSPPPRILCGVRVARVVAGESRDYDYHADPGTGETAVLLTRSVQRISCSPFFGSFPKHLQMSTSIAFGNVPSVKPRTRYIKRKAPSHKNHNDIYTPRQSRVRKWYRLISAPISAAAGAVCPRVCPLVSATYRQTVTCIHIFGRISRLSPAAARNVPHTPQVAGAQDLKTHLAQHICGRVSTMGSPRRPSFVAIDHLEFQSLDLSDNLKHRGGQCEAGPSGRKERSSTASGTSSAAGVASDPDPGAAAPAPQQHQEELYGQLRKPTSRHSDVGRRGRPRPSCDEGQFVTYERGKRSLRRSASVEAECRALMVESERLYIARSSCPTAAAPSSSSIASSSRSSKHQHK